MNRRNLLKRNASNSRPEEIIDGVRIVHTGIFYKQPIPLSSLAAQRKYIDREILEMYDANGNHFYTNCSSIKDAEQLVVKLQAEGKDAVIGPKAPWRSYTGKLLKNQEENAVGVYFVNKEKQNI